MSAWAALAYLPLPGWQVVPVLAAPRDRAVRYHAWQAGTTVLALWLACVLLGLLAVAAPALAAPVAVAGGLLIVAAIGAMAAAALSAARGRYLRIPGAWHLLAWIKH